MTFTRFPHPALRTGISIIEIIVAVGLMLVIAGGAVGAILGSFSSTRLAKEELVATALAEEGLEAVDSIRNQDWSNLSQGTYGLSESGGTWAFSGSSDTDDSGRFTRQVEISTVQRDGNDQVVTSGGTVDDETYLATVSVNWDFSPGRQNTVTLTKYFTRWSLAKGSTSSSGEVTCASYCQTQGYSTGTCRASTVMCALNSETYESGGDTYCTGGASADTCCCAP